MSAFAPMMVAASAAILFSLGIIHLVYTFYGPKLRPRDPELQASMSEMSPVITRETNMWKCWIGFNASHSLGAILFGTVYGYLALRHGAFLFESSFLLLLGLLTLSSYVYLGYRYWFSIPSGSIVLATILYSLGLLAQPG